MCIDFVQTHARYVCNCIRVSLMCMHYIIKKNCMYIWFTCIYRTYAYSCAFPSNVGKYSMCVSVREFGPHPCAVKPEGHRGHA